MVHSGVPAGAELEWLARQEPTSRAELQLPMGELVRRRPPGVEVRRTSGSTGTPFTFVKSLEMTAWMDAAMWAAYRWHGVDPGMPHARFWGVAASRRGRLIQQIKDRMLQQYRLSAFEITPERANAFYTELVRRAPAYAYGYPTAILAFVQRCAAAGLDGRAIGCRVVICTGELLLPATRDSIEQFFGCRCVNEYGCTESGVLGFECERGRMHAIPVAAYVEVLDEANRSMPDGEYGELTVTDLYGRVAPLLRYRLHDGAATDSEACDCGRALPRLAIERGRLGSFIVTPSRGPVFSTILPYTVPPGVGRFRVVQSAADHLDADIVILPGADSNRTADECRRRWEEALGPDLSVSIRIVDDIAPERSGKLRYFIPLPE